MLFHLKVITPNFVLFALLFSAVVLPAQEGVPSIPALLQPAGPQMEDGLNGKLIARTQEDFTSLGLATSSLIESPVISGGHEENKDFIRDLIRVQWRANDPIDLFVVRPAGVKNPPVVLYLLSFPTDSNRFQDSAFCRRLTQNGVAAVGFASALTGQRYSYRPMKQWFVSELPEALASTVHDTQMILNYLADSSLFNMDRVGMFGQGSGGAIAVLSAAADKRIKAIDLLDPWGDWPDFFAESRLIPENERPDYLKPEFLKKLQPLEPSHYLPELASRGMRIQFVDAKPPSKMTATLEGAAPPHAIVKNFATTEDLRSSTGAKLFDWTADQLKNLPDTPGKTSGGQNGTAKNGASQ